MILDLFYPILGQNSTKKDPFATIKSAASSFESKFKPTAKIVWVSLHVQRSELDRVGQLAYLDILAARLPSSKVLLFHVNPSMRFGLEFVNRVHLKTIDGFQVFFPLPFVEYKLAASCSKSQDVLTVNSASGYFDGHSTDGFGFYVSDYLSARKWFNSSSLRFAPFIAKESELVSGHYDGVGGVLDLFVEYSKRSRGDDKDSLFILRVVDPELKERYFKWSSCSRNDFGSNVCSKRSIEGLGLKSQLASLLIEDGKPKDDPNYR